MFRSIISTRLVATIAIPLAAIGVLTLPILARADSCDVFEQGTKFYKCCTAEKKSLAAYTAALGSDAASRAAACATLADAARKCGDAGFADNVADFNKQRAKLNCD